jgi:hypothetical protein
MQGLDGNWLYVADAEDSAVRRIQLTGDRVETLVGTGLFDFGDRDGPFREAKLQHVLGIAASRPDRILIADTNNHRIIRFDPNCDQASEWKAGWRKRVSALLVAQ